MLNATTPIAMLGLFNLGGEEVILILALILILYGAKNHPGLMQGLDRKSHDAGRTFGGIYGKRAAQALTPDNQTRELYDPAAFRRRFRKRGVFQNLVRRCRVVWHFICKVVGSRIRASLNWSKRQ